MTIGMRLKRWLRYKGLSIRDLAEQSSVPYRTLQNYLGDDRQPGAEHLSRLRSAGIDLNWLLAPVDASDDEAGLVASDGELLRAITERVLAVLSDVQKFRTEKGAPPLDVVNLIAFGDRLVWYAVRSATARAAQVARLKEKGESDTIIDLVMGDVKSRATEEAMIVEILMLSHRAGTIARLAQVFAHLIPGPTPRPGKNISAPATPVAPEVKNPRQRKPRS